jgi:demethylmenaquinone methyltransferase/2-methoxy-6-polyprenyl-1,4-benzoquinol methylase
MNENPEKNWFGEEEVTPEEKTQKVRGVFDSVAPKYDVMNDVMSGGLHRIWKDRLIQMIRPRPGLSYLDVAGGTGDIAFRILKKIRSQPAYTDAKTKITLCDLDEDMLRVGRDRAYDRGYLNDFDWVTGNAEYLPLPDNSVDVYTISFGLRNVTHIDTALKEAKRVLKPGGRFFCLEFSHIKDPLLSKAYDAYSYNFIPKFGEFVAGDADSYQYLVESIRKFPTQQQLVNRLQSAGFNKPSSKNMTFGVVCIHKAYA